MGRSLHELGLETEDPVRDLTAGFSAVVDHEPSYCVLGQADDYTIVVTQNKADVNQNIPTIMLTTLLYLLLAVAVICFLAWRMTRHIIDEQKNANTDMLTGLANRRAYENEIAALAGDPRREDLTYIVLDLNGLKTANDTWGHEAGDELLTNVSRYMVDCFGDYGTVYRTGGDEFVALLFVEDAQLTIAEEEFSSLLDAWSRRRGRELSVSWGTAKAREEPELSIPELAKKADDRMYAAKAAYYKAKGRDRRR